MKNHFKAFRDSDLCLSVFLVLPLLLVLVIIPFFSSNTDEFLGLDIFFGILLVTGILATADSYLLTAIAIGALITRIVLGLVKIYIGSGSALYMYQECLDLLCLLLFFYVITKRVLKDGPFTYHRVQGGIAAYLLIGIIWGKAYLIAYTLVPGSFTGLNPNDLMASICYFSFVTLTTVGYGDIVPVHSLSRSLANSEALLGQLFPAIFIARLVTLEIDARKKK